MRTKKIPDQLKDEIMATGLFHQGNPSFYIFDLIGTKFEFLIFTTSSGETIWRVSKDKWRTSQENRLSFQYVFENVPLEIQEKLIDHLDLFSC